MTGHPAVARTEMRTPRLTAADLKRAVARHELVLEYQPLVALATGRISAVEALVRWQHPRFGQLAPGAFLPLAEHSGVIVDIDRYVLSRACADRTGWRRAGLPNVRVAVNVSVQSVEDPRFIEHVAAIQLANDIPLGGLELEVTESADLGDSRVAVSALNELRASGVEIALDDFGTGYSVLDRLRLLPFDALKIDRSFVSALDAAAGPQLVIAAIALGRALGLRVVAEGVETRGELSFLIRHACDEAQGYLLGRPASLERTAERLRAPDAMVATLTDERHELLSSDASALERVVRPLLGELGRLTGLESTYLTVIDRARDQQVILYARNSGELVIGEGLEVPWMDTVCKRSLESGVRCTSDVASTFPDSPAGRDLGLQSYAGVPIVGRAGVVWGTLCGASRDRHDISDPTLTVMEAFARLIANQLRVDDWRVPRVGSVA